MTHLEIQITLNQDWWASVEVENSIDPFRDAVNQVLEQKMPVISARNQATAETVYFELVASKEVQLATNTEPVDDDDDVVDCTIEDYDPTIEEALKWIEEHGSSRLKKAVMVGMLEQSMGVYFTERLEKEMPGWEFARPGVFNHFKAPTEKALDELIEALQSNLLVELKWHVRQSSAALVSQFLGKTIYKRISR